MPPWMIGCSMPNSSVIAVFTNDLPRCRSVDDFKQAGRAHAATDAHGYDAVLRLAPPALDQQMAGKPRTGHAVGMADRDRATIDVELVGIDAELVPAV